MYMGGNVRIIDTLACNPYNIDKGPNGGRWRFSTWWSCILIGVGFWCWGFFADQGPILLSPPTFYVPIVVSISITKVLLASFFLLSALGLAWSIGVCKWTPMAIITSPDHAQHQFKVYYWGQALVEKLQTLLWMRHIYADVVLWWWLEFGSTFTLHSAESKSIILLSITCNV